MLTLLFFLIIVSFLIFINGLYVAGEFSAVSARKTRILQAAQEGNRLARTLLPVITDPHKLDNYIAACQVGITLSSIVLGIYGEQQIAPYLTPWIARLPLGDINATGIHVAATAIASTLVLILLTTLQVIMGELVPKSIAIQYPEKVALITALPMKWSADFILKPLVVLLNGSGRFLLKLLGASGEGSHPQVYSPDEILILAQESQQGGLIEAEENRLLHNVFLSSERRAGDVAVPRTHIIAANADRSVREVLKMAADSAYTRIPIYENDIDHIIGFVHLRDLFILYRTDPEADVRSLVRSMPFIPETLTTSEVWQRLDEAKSYLAIVFDEYGGTNGLITREDLIEELFGELQDEFDQEQALITYLEDGYVSVCGDVLISTLNELLGINLPQDNSRTIGGLIMNKLGRIPIVGDEVDVSGILMVVDAVEHKSTSSVRMLISSTEVE